MPIFVALGKVTAEGARQMEGLGQRHERAIKRAEGLGAKVLASYALLGSYDYLTIVDCPDEQTAFKVLAGEAAHGHVHYETLTAIPFEEFAGLLGG